MHAFSIALCTCNGGRFLDEQLRTLRVQQGVTEIIVVDDCSTDETWAILTVHAAVDSRLRLHRNATRLGVARNFEMALRLVTNSWVALADQDDVWLSEKLARLRVAWDGQASLLHHATHKFAGAVPPGFLPSPAGERLKFSGSDVRRLLFRNTVVGHTILMRTAVARRLMPFPDRVPHDWWLAVGAALLGSVQYLDEYLVHYRIHDRNAYHAAGSRWRRISGEHRLRLGLLRAVAGWTAPGSASADFVRAYWRLSETCEPGTFPWRLLGFYFQHASLLFGGGGRVSAVRRVRKSLQAALGAMFQVPSVEAGKILRPERSFKPAVVPAKKRTG